jgi:peptide/nickel transport system substrate-binding protein
MLRMSWKSFAILSAVLLSCVGWDPALARPKYGGTLRVTIQATVGDFHPATWTGDPLELSWKRKLNGLVFERLVDLDQQGQPQPLLAESWRQSNDGRRWEFRLRAGVRFHDGTPLTAEIAAGALKSSIFAFRVWSEADHLLFIESDLPDADLPAKVAHSASAVFLQAADGALHGTGPFALSHWESNRRAQFAANEGYWRGRPYLDSVVVIMGRTLRDQRLDLQAGKADLIELPIEGSGESGEPGLRVWSSSLVELMLLVFEKNRQPVRHAEIRRSVANSFSREIVHEVLLAKRGEPSRAFLPQWLTGYAFLFATTHPGSPPRLSLPPGQSLLVGYPQSDALARTIAERLALDCGEAGIAARAVPAESAGGYDASLKRLRLTSLKAGLALRFLAEQAELSPDLPTSPSLEDLLATESSLLDEAWAVPLFYLPVSYGISRGVKFQRVQDFLFFDDWSLSDVWLETPLSKSGG